MYLPCLRHRESGAAIPDEGIEDAFEVLGEMPDIVSTATWVGDCFLYTNVSNRCADDPCHTHGALADAKVART